MKRLLFLLSVAFLPLLLLAQLKVAILETVDKEGNLSYAHKLMLRSNLAKAITNAPGYEAYDRTDMDAIMGEQNFQRTGMVSEDQIKRLGEMTGAAYILVAEAVKVDEQNMFITAKILNVETGKTEATDNLLMAATPSDIQHGCESLANKLLGLGAAIVNPLPVNVQTNLNQQNRVTQAATEAASAAEIKQFSDGTRGVVFYKTADGHGLAVSLIAASLKWENVNRSRDCHDIAALPNESGDKQMTFGDGINNTNAIVQTLGATQAAAAYWCMLQGTGWYLPSAGELWYLLAQANGGNCEDGAVSTALKAAGGYPLNSSDWYWSSTENDDDEAINVSCSGRMSSEDKYSEKIVRAVRAF